MEIFFCRHATRASNHFFFFNSLNQNSSYSMKIILVQLLSEKTKYIYENLRAGNVSLLLHGWTRNRTSLPRTSYVQWRGGEKGYPRRSLNKISKIALQPLSHSSRNWSESEKKMHLCWRRIRGKERAREMDRWMKFPALSREKRGTRARCGRGEKEARYKSSR